MSLHKLKIVDTDRKHNQPKKAAPADNPYFFHKGQMTVGTRLRYIGRTDPNGMWIVKGIRSYSYKTNKERWVDIVQQLNDDVHLENTDTGERRQAMFAYLSYSAIWRLA